MAVRTNMLLWSILTMKLAPHLTEGAKPIENRLARYNEIFSISIEVQFKYFCQKIISTHKSEEKELTVGRPFLS